MAMPMFAQAQSERRSKRKKEKGKRMGKERIVDVDREGKEQEDTAIWPAKAVISPILLSEKCRNRVCPLRARRTQGQGRAKGPGRGKTMAFSFIDDPIEIEIFNVVPDNGITESAEQLLCQHPPLPNCLASWHIPKYYIDLSPDISRTLSYPRILT